MMRLAIVASLALAAAGCASTTSDRDVAAVVQDERARPAVAEEAKEEQSAKAAHSDAAEASDATREPPHQP